MSDEDRAPVASFHAYHQNFLGVASTGEMKITLIIPTDEKANALKVADTGGDMLWIQVSRVKPPNLTGNLAALVAAQQAERDQHVNGHTLRDGHDLPDDARGELDWDE